MLFNDIARKWQQRWADANAFQATAQPAKEKMYCLDMYPYPSGSMHMGHVRNYSIGDALARFYRMNKKNILYPMGFDAFGLPAENAAIKDGKNPATHTLQNMDTIRQQFQDMGFSFDWSREIASLHPEYYKWTQWIFLQLYKKGLAYRKEAAVNWCPSCTTVLANEQVEDSKCWRCSTVVEEKLLPQWFFKITAYAESLLNDLASLDEWPDRVKVMQENWIGKSTGTEVFFKVKGIDLTLPCFTTRVDTLFSTTFLVIAPEHPLVSQLIAGTAHAGEVRQVFDTIKHQTTIERTTPEGKDKIGAFTGRYAVNPANGKQIPIYVANFVLMEHGTGIVMANAHDTRDFAFARKYNIPLAFVISEDGRPTSAAEAEEAFVQDGILFDSAQFSGMKNREALPKIQQWLLEQQKGKAAVYYKLRDWLISRQRYWGTPIPILYCDTCGIVPVAEEELPVLLPKDVVFSGKENPLTTSSQFKQALCPGCGKDARRETDTMDTFVDSSWYFLRFCSPHESALPFNKEEVDYWMPVNQYTGGIEHAVLHLLYARFFTKALRDLGLHSIDEPFKQLLCQGMILADGLKMSKSKGNVVSPTAVVDAYGPDTARMFVLFASLPEKDFEWSDDGVAGIARFLKRIFAFLEEHKDALQQGQTADTPRPQDKLIVSKIHLTIEKVTAFIEERRFNMAISCLMDFFSSMQKAQLSSFVLSEVTALFAQLLTPFAPHLAEEIWERTGHALFVSLSSWPIVDKQKIQPEALAAEELIETLKTDILSVLTLSKIKQPTKMVIYLSEQWKYDFFPVLKQQLATTRDFKHILDAVMMKEHASAIATYVKKALQQNIFPSFVLSQQQELAVLQENLATLTELLQRLSKQFSQKDISILSAEQAPPEHKQKARQVSPGKPAIFLL